ncbi:unnamed protein product [Polarella glacialis]|uniref:S1 motif domain-containing protein n=1 Tax=Polarella glacialis TaxID=89957 RepID=A0A813DKJ6_POLGL|nr:unnamed protein product [Polarella glacialis]
MGFIRRGRSSAAGCVQLTRRAKHAAATVAILVIGLIWRYAAVSVGDCFTDLLPARPDFSRATGLSRVQLLAGPVSGSDSDSNSAEPSDFPIFGQDAAEPVALFKPAGAGAKKIKPSAAPTKPPAERIVRPPLLKAADLRAGDELDGIVVGLRGESHAWVDIGAESDAVLEAGEMQDGFPMTCALPVRKNKEVRCRVLEIDEKGRISVTLRSGSIERPPRLKREDENSNPEAFRRVSDEEWLDAEVVTMQTFGVFVNVKPIFGSKPVLAMLHKSQFAGDFATNPTKAIRGGKVKVRKLKISDGNELRVTMKPF